jgi:hypothetical protein
LVRIGEDSKYDRFASKLIDRVAGDTVEMIIRSQGRTEGERQAREYLDSVGKRGADADAIISRALVSYGPRGAAVTRRYKQPEPIDPGLYYARTKISPDFVNPYIVIVIMEYGKLFVRSAEGAHIKLDDFHWYGPVDICLDAYDDEDEGIF